MPLLIATDEAGYGPKLGPLVICASVWFHPTDNLPEAFSALQRSFAHKQVGKIRIDDSKKIFISGKHTSPSSLSVPDVILRTAARWASQPDPISQTKQWLTSVLSLDWPTISKESWLFASNCTGASDDEEQDALVKHWSADGIIYRGCLARLITPAVFNQAIQRGQNKADLLTESTCRLVNQVLEQWAFEDDWVTVISDRHGGRMYYAAPLQHVFTESMPMVVSESSQDSRYRFTHQTSRERKITLDWSFRVGGDSFPPVGFSSIIAKWIREYSMAGLNQFVASQLPANHSIRPTAGYPEDAARFIREVNAAVGEDLFQKHGLVRLR